MQKKELRRKRERELVELNRTVQATRAETRQSIREARWRSTKRNKSSKMEVSRRCDELRMEMKSSQMSRLEEKRVE